MNYRQIVLAFIVSVSNKALSLPDEQIIPILEPTKPTRLSDHAAILNDPFNVTTLNRMTDSAHSDRTQSEHEPLSLEFNSNESFELFNQKKGIETTVQAPKRTLLEKKGSAFLHLFGDEKKIQSWFSDLSVTQDAKILKAKRSATFLSWPAEKQLEEFTIWIEQEHEKALEHFKKNKAQIEKNHEAIIKQIEKKIEKLEIARQDHYFDPSKNKTDQRIEFERYSQAIYEEEQAIAKIKEETITTVKQLQKRTNEKLNETLKRTKRALETLLNSNSSVQYRIVYNGTSAFYQIITNPDDAKSIL